jgi:HK97 family phage major capsid protein
MNMTPEEIRAELGRLFAEFQKSNDARIAEIEKKGRADPLLEEKVDKMAKGLDELETKLGLVEKAAGRIGAAADRAEADEVKSAHRKAFSGRGGYLRKGTTQFEDGDLASLQEKALQVGVDADGGFAIPEELDRSIGQMEIAAAPMEGLVSSITAGAETYEKLMDLRGAASGWVGETAARPDTNTPTLGSFKPFYGEVYASPKATQKMLDDAFFDVESWLGSSVVEKFAQDVDLAIISGDGTTKPKGILAYTLAATADSARAYGTIEKLHSGVAGDFDADDLIDLSDKLAKGYLANARWVMAQGTLTKIRKLKGTDGHYLLQPSIQQGTPPTLLGYSWTIDNNVPAVAASANAILFGDFRRAYKIVNIRGVRVLRDPFTDKPYVKFYTTKRVGGGVEDTAAVKVLTLAI